MARQEPESILAFQLRKSLELEYLKREVSRLRAIVGEPEQQQPPQQRARLIQFPGPGRNFPPAA